jgi:hypothetical protein
MFYSIWVYLWNNICVVLIDMGVNSRFFMVTHFGPGCSVKAVMELYRDSGPSEERKRGLGEDPPGSTITYLQVVRTWLFSQGSDGALP